MAHLREGFILNDEGDPATPSGASGVADARSSQATDQALQPPVAPAHSPLPWVVHDTQYGDVSVRDQVLAGENISLPLKGISDANGETCRTIIYTNAIYHGKRGVKELDEEAANAEFIVRACNSHYPMVELLRKVSLACHDADDTIQLTARVMSLMDDIDAAIAKASAQ